MKKSCTTEQPHQHCLVRTGRRSPDCRDQRGLQSLCDDRLADRLCSRAKRPPDRHGEYSKPEYVQPLFHLAKGCSRGHARRWCIHRKDGDRVRSATARHGRTPERDARGPLPNAQRSILCVPQCQGLLGSKVQAENPTPTDLANYLLQEFKVAVFPVSRLGAPAYSTVVCDQHGHDSPGNGSPRCGIQTAHSRMGKTFSTRLPPQDNSP